MNAKNIVSIVSTRDDNGECIFFNELSTRIDVSNTNVILLVSKNMNTNRLREIFNKNNIENDRIVVINNTMSLLAALLHTHRNKLFIISCKVSNHLIRKLKPSMVGLFDARFSNIMKIKNIKTDILNFIYFENPELGFYLQNSLIVYANMVSDDNYQKIECSLISNDKSHSYLYNEYEVLEENKVYRIEGPSFDNLYRGGIA